MIRLSRTARTKLIGGGILGLVMSTSFLFRDVHDYLVVGSQPTEMTMTQVTEAAVTRPFVPHWIRLTEPLQIDCSQARESTEDGKVSMIVLAFDSSKQQAFWLEYKNNPNCSEVKDTVFEGMLVEPEKFWIKQGMVQPSLSYHLMELKIGETSSDLRKGGESFAVADLLFIMMLCVGFWLPADKVQSMAASSSRL